MTELERALEALNITATGRQLELFEQYARLLLEWNERVNLTRITQPDEIATKHFADSLLPLPSIPEGARCLDVGTGAGFPGLPIAIMRRVELTLLDSQKKRVDFLRHAVAELGITADCVQARAEDAAHTTLRERFDVVVSRALAPAPVLMEYMLPFCKIDGVCIAYKGREGKSEVESACGAIKTLGGEILRVEEYGLPWGARAIAYVGKRIATKPSYPRKAGLPAKSPL